MLSPEFLMSVSDDVVLLFLQAEMDITQDIARRIVKTGRLTETARFQAERAKQFGLLSGNIDGILSHTTGLSKREIKRIINKAGAASLRADDKIYIAAGLTPSALEDSPALSALLLQGTDSTLKLASNFTKTTATMSKVAYINSIDRAYIEAMSGAVNPTTAIRNAIKRIASNGIEKVAYPSGGYQSVEASVRRAITTGLNQSVAKLQMARMDEMGCNLVEVSSHAGARPSHAEWQGGIYSRSRKHSGYDNFYDVTGYGTGEGLCGWNCYHSFFPYFEGLSSSSFSRDPAADAERDNDEEYSLQQKQRYHERQVRSAKKECSVINAAMEETNDEELRRELYEDFQRSSVKLKNREAALEEFTKKNGRIRQREREVTGEWNRSVSSKAVWANRKAKEGK